MGGPEALPGEGVPDPPPICTHGLGKVDGFVWAPAALWARKETETEGAICTETVLKLHWRSGERGNSHREPLIRIPLRRAPAGFGPGAPLIRAPNRFGARGGWHRLYTANLD